MIQIKEKAAGPCCVAVVGAHRHDDASALDSAAMTRRLASRRLLVALIGLALVLPSALPHPAVAATGGLPAALALICSVDGGEGTDAPDTGAWHDPCDGCTGACHGMAGTLAASGLPHGAVSWPPAHGIAAAATAAVMAAIAAHAPRAPPAA